MAPNKPFTLGIADAAERSTDRLEEWKRNLTQLIQESPNGMETSQFLSRELRAASIVASMAEVESIFRTFLDGLSHHINANRIEIRDIRHSLRPIAAESSFDSIAKTGNFTAKWDQKICVTSLEHNTDHVKFPTFGGSRPQPPLDGKTIRPYHVSYIWKLLGIQGSPFPNTSSPLALTKLADLRNDIAHCNSPIEEVFKSPGTSLGSIMSYLDDMILFIYHQESSFGDYARNKEFLAPK